MSGESGVEVNSYHGRFLDGAKTVDENVDSVFHRNSWVWRTERREGALVASSTFS